ncbi:MULTISPECIES: BCCT family transporter [Rhodococcus]|uniref:BCCT family transporter n=1 Tax=Rhodococcus oxybenzonivorans TaxID=1990687 RepID=A0AAE4V098_9NOCA|nr:MULTISPECIES: BCCT family transporter [Rhodococcus]MDV7240576.1 BCCT family transporter [Rhodococcus oxybenzonivorans]MDV7265729.1 BCCT family transporter [Rhodococcus oxybenzonivorans]MDV7272849.1 BCCT family transporter [Rhodococcus oxybenzonivorans]MDV7333412.1 BCCT family transporter [Rhodococcus oxybenzonivorans]MDV7342579.1 BCCT family transporter [Rhodococcus oxybenzonivorans]
MTSAHTTRSLIDSLKDAHSLEDQPQENGLDKIVFGVAAVLAIGFVAWGVISPTSLGSVAASALQGAITNLGWLFVIAATIFTVFILVVGLGRFGRIPLGKDGDQPRFKTSSWIAMMFATGMGIGLVFYGVAEPLYFYLSPPPGTVEASTPEALNVSMGQTLFHWTLFPWAMYAIVGLGMAYGTYRLGRTQLFSSMFTSIFGAKVVNGAGGRVINVLAILATLFGSACSLGLGAVQIGGGIESSGIIPAVTSPVLAGVIAVLTAAFVASAVSGIERGIQWLSNINMVLAVILAIVVFLGGPTLFILNVLPDAIGAFIGHLPEMASRTAAAGDESMAAWMSGWTVFYWAWWISWTPFVGMFIARVSRGRTIRQFVTGVLLVPSIVSTLWFTIFGGGAIGIQQRAEHSGNTDNAIVQIVDGTPDINFDTALFGLLNALPFPGWLTIALTALTVVLIAIFFVTGADSASIVMGMLSENGTQHPRRMTIIFWGVATGGVAAVMLLAGGSDPSAALNGLKNITIVSAVPFVIVMLLLCVALWKDLSRDPLVIRTDLAQHLLTESISAGVETHAGEPFTLSTIEITAVPSAADPAEPSTQSGNAPARGNVQPTTAITTTALASDVADGPPRDSDKPVTDNV